MDTLLNELTDAANRCERAAEPFEIEPLVGLKQRLLESATGVGRAWSGSWIGHHSRLYLANLRPREPGDVFDSEWGLDPGWSNQTAGVWKEYSDAGIEKEILKRSAVRNFHVLEEAAREARNVFDETRRHVAPTLDAIMSGRDDVTLGKARDEIEKLKSHISRHEYFEYRRPKQVVTRDRVALAHGIQAPPHFVMEARVIELVSHGPQLKRLADQIRRAVVYLEQRNKMMSSRTAPTHGKVFIGHGRSMVWKDLREFLRVSLRLEPVEFNSQPVAGVTTKERLEEMLGEASFAFLLMTGEDELADGSARARENVVHEVGLFQGRLGFRRAIVLLEEGCNEFSNITGLGQIRFPKDNIGAKFEEIRQVLQREGITS